MSDYFSVKPVPENDETTATSSNLTVGNRNNNNNSQDDLRSIHSSQYLMDILPDTVTIAKDPSMISNTTIPTGYSSTINNIPGGYNNGNNNYSRDYILPKTDRKSPYYVSVPIPNPNAKGQKSASSATMEGSTDDTEEYFVREYPTDILMDRFYKWKKVLKGLINYLREIAYSQEQFARINIQLRNSVKFHFLTDLEEGSNRLVDPFTTAKPVKKLQPKTLAQQKMDSTKQQQQKQQPQDENEFSEYPPSNIEEPNDILATSGFMKFGSGSIQDIQVVLKKHHLALSNQQLKISKEILSVLIPKLETLRKDLNFKIKEIKELHSDFKTNMNQHLIVTQKLLHKYIASVKYMNALINKKKGNSGELIDLQPKHDPFLLKLQLDLQLKKQIAEENYLQEAYINLQSSGMKLEKIIYSKIQHAMQRYSALIDSEARLTIKNLCHELQQGILSKPPAIEWDHFVTHHPTCLIDWKSNDPLPLPRKLSEIVYPNMKTPFAKCIRAGYFYKKSNYSKDYKKSYFVLTPNYLHEFKSSNFYEMGNNNLASAPQSGATTPATTPGSTTPLTSNMTTLSAASTTAIQGQHTSLTPILSIPLNECSLTKVSDHHFTLKGKAIFIEPTGKTRTPSVMNSHSSSFANLTAAAGNGSYANASPLSKKKSPFSKLLNPSKSRQLKQEQQQRLAELQQETSIKEKESRNIVTWVFKSCNEDDNGPGNKHFKKWVQDLKSLCAYNSTNERMQFIEEKLWKNHLNRSAKMMNSTASGSNVPTLNDYNGSAQNVDTSSSTVHLMEMSMRQTNRPQYIAINSSPMLNHEQSFRSKLNTPAIDDNGNLITMAERKNYSFSPNTYIQTPAFSPNYSSVSDLSSMTNNDQTISPAQQQHNQPQQQGIPTVVTPTGINVTKHHHQRNVSLPVSLGHVNAVNSPASVISDGSGYFGIPVHRGSTEHVQTTVTPPLSRTTSRGTSSINMNRVPKVKLNNQDLKEVRPAIKENSSTGSLPSLNKQNTNEFYQRANSSASNLAAAQTSRVHPIRKHKKNVSFSSLNSLMFAKKGGSSAAFTGNQLIGGGIREDDADDADVDQDSNKQPADSDKIKLNQSIYS